MTKPKDLLKNGMKVVMRNEKSRIFVDGNLYDEHFVPVNNMHGYDDFLRDSLCNELDVMKIVDGCAVVWKRDHDVTKEICNAAIAKIHNGLEELSKIFEVNIGDVTIEVRIKDKYGEETRKIKI